MDKDLEPKSSAQQSMVIDVSHTTPDLVELITSFFAAKNAHDPVKTMAFFSQEKLTYIDGTLGWIFSTMNYQREEEKSDEHACLRSHPL